MLRVAFAGTFAARLKEPVRRHLATTCEIIVADESGIIAQLADLDVLVTMALTGEMGRAATRLKLVQVPGAGLDRIDRSALPDGARLANAYGHETGIAEYVIGGMVGRRRPASGLAGTGGQNDRNTWLWAYWSGGRSPRSRLRHECLCNTPRCAALYQR